MTDFPKPLHYPLFVIISGPSGAGKDSLVREVMQRSPDFHFVITMATRAPRKGEQEGVDYFFVSREQFEDLIGKDGFIEYSNVYGDYKGVPREQVRLAMESGKDILVRVDVQGAAKLHEILPEAILVFLVPEDEEAWLMRFKRRGDESDENLHARISAAERELREVDWFDYILVNHEGCLSETADQFLAILSAEHQRVHPRIVQI